MDQPITRAEHISIHALREEGDPFSAVRFWLQKVFLSTPSARRATNYESTWRDGIFISIHALREEGDGQSLQKDLTMDVFLSTPSARRATCVQLLNQRIEVISIHALREEGDLGHFGFLLFFFGISIHALREEGDLSNRLWLGRLFISIHALREEGDWRFLRGFHRQIDFYPRPPRGGRLVDPVPYVQSVEFLSTPSARRATDSTVPLTWTRVISIHALREEGDLDRPPQLLSITNFYPRPPRGGRPGEKHEKPHHETFLSTPSARRATRQRAGYQRHHRISIHALREEGDPAACSPPPSGGDFYPRPPRGGRLSLAVSAW